MAELYPTSVPKIPTLSTFRMLVNARTRETRDHLMERKRESLKERGEDFAKLQQMLQDIDAEMLDEESVVSLAEEVERMYEKILTKRGINPKKKPLKDEFADDPFFHILPPVMRAYPGKKLCKCNFVGRAASQIRFALQRKPVMRCWYVKTRMKVAYDAHPA